jgi:hypothetical protein
VVAYDLTKIARAIKLLALGRKVVPIERSTVVVDHAFEVGNVLIRALLHPSRAAPALSVIVAPNVRPPYRSPSVSRSLFFFMEQISEVCVLLFRGI